MASRLHVSKIRTPRKTQPSDNSLYLPTSAAIDLLATTITTMAPHALASNGTVSTASYTITPSSSMPSSQKLSDSYHVDQYWRNASWLTSVTMILWLYVAVSLCIFVVLLKSGKIDHKLEWKCQPPREDRYARLDIWRGTSLREPRIDSPHLRCRPRRTIATNVPSRPTSIAETDLGLGGEVVYYPHAGYAHEAPYEMQTMTPRLAGRPPTAWPGSGGTGDLSQGSPQELSAITAAQLRGQRVDQAREEQEIAWQRIQQARVLEAALGRISALGFT